jgi:glycosyltransferase involved in cell wall biosynthesis
MNAHSPTSPPIDVVMRTRDRLQFLPRAVASLRAQTYRDWNLIILDSGDAGATARWLAANPGRSGEALRHVAIAPGQLMGGLSNRGIAEGNAPYVVLLDDDDTWHPRFLECAMARLLARADDPGCRGVACWTEMVYEEITDAGIIETRREIIDDRLRRITLPALATVNQFSPNSFVYERGAWEELGGYDESLPVLDDWEFNLRFLTRWDIDLIPEPLAYWHRRPAAGGASDNSPFQEHEFHRARIINNAIRRKMSGQPSPMAELFLAGEINWVQRDRLHRILGKLTSTSRKVGRIDERMLRGQP